MEHSSLGYDLVQVTKQNCGSRIILTTRIDTVAKACSDDNDYYIHRMKKLNEEDSKKLFVRKAFGSGHPCPKDLERTMCGILKKCGGLPLAIVSIGSLLASCKPPEGKEMWKLVQRSIGSQMESNPTLEGMRQILTLSYNHLPHLSIFPEDYTIRKDRMLKRWIAEGLVAKKRGLTQMELAEGYFNELMSRSMIEWADGRQESYRVHDMMLEILVSKSLESSFVSLVGGQHEGMTYTDTIRRLSVHGGVEGYNEGSSSSSSGTGENNITGNGAGIKGMMMQHVRSLSVFDPEVNNMLLDRLRKFTLLRVLDLEDCKGLGKKHMSCICRLYLLRFLSLKGTDIKEMPPRVGYLEHLQTLDVRETYLEDLPEEVKKLEKLEDLLFSNKSTSWWSLSRLRQVHLQNIKDRMHNKLAGWHGKLLNMGGRRELVRSVLSSLPTYLLTAIKPPKGFLRELDTIGRKFLWAGDQDLHGGKCKVNWNRVCRPLSKGGLGIIDLDKFSRSLRLRWLWIQWKRPYKPWVGAQLPVDKSDLQLFAATTTVCVHNGQTANFWNSSWLYGSAPASRFPALYQHSKRKNRTVADALSNDNWISDLLPNIPAPLLPEYVTLWTVVHDSCFNSSDTGEDEITWTMTPSGEYSARSAYAMQFQGST